MTSKFITHKKAVLKLRRQGLTYGEIKKNIGIEIPKSTLSCWLSSVKLTNSATKKLQETLIANISRARAIAIEKNRANKNIRLKKIASNIEHFKKTKIHKDLAKIILTVLYLGEGAKSRKNSLMLGNSDPRIIRLFLGLLRKNYPIEENKFRCTVQCRADQNITELEKFWSEITNISPKQFYKARIDPRTIGKKSKKTSYKGVCRIDYFSSDIYNEIKMLMEIVCNLGI